jgi:ribonuclease D
VVRTDTNPQLNLLGQFLATALASVCRQAEVASSLVGTVNDVREFIAWRLDGETPGEGEMPHLARGWRAEIVGRTLDDLLEGRLTVSVVDPRSERPLRFEPRNGAAGN